MSFEIGLGAFSAAIAGTVQEVPCGGTQAQSGRQDDIPFEVDLGDGNTFADLMGGGMAVVEQVTSDTGKHTSVVFSREQLEQMLVPQFSEGGLGDHTMAHAIGEGFMFVEQMDEETEEGHAVTVSMAQVQQLLWALA